MAIEKLKVLVLKHIFRLMQWHLRCKGLQDFDQGISRSLAGLSAGYVHSNACFHRKGLKRGYGMGKTYCIRSKEKTSEQGTECTMTIYGNISVTLSPHRWEILTGLHHAYAKPVNINVDVDVQAHPRNPRHQFFGAISPRP